jgi:ATP-binding cassette subfamily B protein RaxB
MIAAYYGHTTDMATLRQRLSAFIGNLSPPELIEPAAALGLTGRLLYITLDQLSTLKTPCVLYWNFRRFVVLERVSGSTYFLNDPWWGYRTLTANEMSTRFTGAALEFVPAASFSKGTDHSRFGLAELGKWSQTTKRSIAYGLALSLFIQILTLLSPIYMQLVIDNVISTGDEGLLAVLALAFGTLALFNAVAVGVRSLLSQYIGGTVALEMSARIHRHLFNLPISFFTKRNQADIYQKFRAVETIRQFFVNGSISAFADGILALVTGALLFLYSPSLAFVVLSNVIIYSAIRLQTNSLTKKYNANLIETDVREGNHFLESVKGVQTIKILALANQRETKWMNFYVGKLDAAMRLSNSTSLFQMAADVLSSLTDVIVIYFAAILVLDGDITLGFVVAFLAYKVQFMGRVTSLMDQYNQYRLLDTQIDRISDIVLTPCEPEYEPAPPVTNGRLQVSNLHFRYQSSQKPILDGIDMIVEAGEFVAIVGASGEGKSTLLKLLLGLFVPDDGDILVDGAPMSNHGAKELRRALGAVMQEDILFSGSIADNISLFDSEFDLARIREAARLSEIDAEISELPHQYFTLVGDLGIVLSTGQKQRLLLARALYRKPKILLLDEGTANLDGDTEARLIATFKEMKMTRIMVAHSHAIARAADRVLEVKKGKLYDVTKERQEGDGARARS